MVMFLGDVLYTILLDGSDFFFFFREIIMVLNHNSENRNVLQKKQKLKKTHTKHWPFYSL